MGKLSLNTKNLRTLGAKDIDQVQGGYSELCPTVLCTDACPTEDYTLDCHENGTFGGSNTCLRFSNRRNTQTVCY